VPWSLAVLTIEKRGDGKRQRGGWRPEVGATSSMADPGHTVVCLRQPTARQCLSLRHRPPPAAANRPSPHLPHTAHPRRLSARPPLVHLQISLPLSYLKVVVVVVRRMPIEGHRRCSRPLAQVMGGGHRRACRLCHRCPPPPATLNTPPHPPSPPVAPNREIERGDRELLCPVAVQRRPLEAAGKDQSPRPCFAR
jgi:hypothetical protein